MSEKEKECSRCKAILPIAAFGKKCDNKSGLMSRCRVCHNESNTAWRRNNPIKRRECDARYNRIHRVARGEYSRQYYQTNRAAKSAHNARYYRAHMLEVKAVAKLNYEKSYRGRIKEQPCAICSATENVQAHHEDYSKPLDVIWLCTAHHRQLHVGTLQIGER